MKIVVWVSCGIPSAVAAMITVGKYGQGHDVRLVNTPVAEEDPDNRRFLANVGEWCGRPIEYAINPKHPDSSARQVWAQHKAMSFPTGAPCTMRLKKDARYHWQSIHRPDWHVLGFTADEQKRHDRFTLTELSNVLPVLIRERMTRERCHHFIEFAGIKPPAIYARGYPNANCIGCVKATSPTYWNHVRRDAPEVFADRAAQSRELGVRLVRVNNQRIFLDELDPAAKGRPMKSVDMGDCGVFCEERP